MKKLILAAVFLALTAACKSKTPEPIPAPKAVDPAPAAAAAQPAQETGLLSMPGNYVRTTVGQVAKAKDAKALFEKTEKERLKELDLTNGK